MKYKIEIWQHGHITETYQSEGISDILNWYKSKWWWVYEMGDCSFTIYENDTELTFEEEEQHGFFD